MDSVISIILFFLIFTLIVLAHEGGHCLIAKKCGIRVYEFMVGIGPAIAKFKKGDTKYSLRVLPFGGACIYDDIEALEKDEERVLDEHHFRNANVFDRIATVFAGPLFNFLFAFVLSVFVLSAVGVDRPIIYDVMDDYPAKEAGIKPGDEIVSLDGHRIFFYREISMFAMFYEDGEPVKLTYKRDGSKIDTILYPKYSEEDGRYLFGFMGSIGREKVNPIKTMGYAAMEVKYWIEATIKSIGMMFSGRFSMDDVAGPVGVAQVVGDTYTESKADGIYYIWINMMNIAILLSSNLGVMNLLPIPAFDGGRIVLLLYEAITKKKPSEKVEAVINMVGFALILSIMAIVMVHDVGRLFK